jgi:hypothetical protein
MDDLTNAFSLTISESLLARERGDRVTEKNDNLLQCSYDRLWYLATTAGQTLCPLLVKADAASPTHLLANR